MPVSSGALSFQNEGQLQAWELRAKQLGLLTPRAPGDFGRGVYRLRETNDMRQERALHR